MKWFARQDSRALMLAALGSFATIGAPALEAQDEAAEPGEDPASEAAALLADLSYQTGRIEIGRLATVDLPEGYLYLHAQDARYVVEDLWGNPPDPSTLGLIHPAAITPLDDDSWAVIVSFESEGYVEDDDAEDIDFDELLETMQEDSVGANEARRKQGYPAIDLVGWAEAPRYDKTAKKLYWAKDLAFEGTPGNVLNYNVRILGRKGYLVYNAVSSIEALPEVAEGCKELLARTEFSEGERYSDFTPGVDKVAAYGIGGLIAGKVLLKVGFFAKFAALFAKSAKLILLALVGVGVMIKKFLTKKSSAPTEGSAG